MDFTMGYVYSVYMLQYNFIVLAFSIFFSLIVAYACQFSSFRFFSKIDMITNYLRKFLTGIMVFSFIIFLLTAWLFIDYLHNYYSNVSFSLFFLPQINDSMGLGWQQFTFFSNFSFSMDLFGFVLLFLAYIVGFISLLALDTRLYWKNFRYVFTFNVFVVIVYLYVTTNNLLLFFLFYEFLLLPSFLFVYFVSPSRRAIQASLYFVIWTQIGSVLVLVVVAYILIVVGGSEFDLIRRYNFSETEVFWLYLMLFCGFGFKVPIWPFHYWLTKTHVEAPSGFSIYLSGFLVKSALYGFYKISTLFSFEISTTAYILICLLGVVDASLKMWGQTDLKKLVAYGTIQEMNLIYLVFCWGDASIVIAGIIFTATHAFLSALMFFIVDCLYRRFHTRSLVEVNGLLHITPNLGISILLMTIFFAGLPGTIKFISEFYIFSGFFEISPFMCLILMIMANVLGLIGFSKAWFNVVFGAFTKYTKYLPMDLTYKEIYIIFINFFFLFILSYLPNFLF